MTTRILVVEDSRTQAEALRFLLSERGFSVTVAPDGEQALALVANGAFDVVLCDITMPGISGYDVCRRIKTQLKRRDLPVILLSSLTDPMDIVQGLEAGADNYIAKPYEPEHLLARIEQVLDNQRLRRGYKSRFGVNVTFLGSTFTITSEKEQILDLLISTFEDAVKQNRQLRRREEELEGARAEIARYAGTLEQRLQQVLRSVPDVLFSISLDGGEVYYISPASTQVFGLAPEQLTADPKLWRDIIEPEDLPAIDAHRRRAAEGKMIQTVEYRIRCPDAGVRWMQTTFAPAADDQGAIVRLDGVARDVTERRRLEEQVRLAQKMEAVGTLAGGVAHDFNNMLAAIKSTVQMVMLDIDSSEPMWKDLEQADQVVDRASALTRQLLAFGRKQVLEPRLVDINTLILDIAKMIGRLIGEDVELAVQQTPDPVTVLADPGQIEQILMNLCVNARDAMPSGGDLAILTERVVVDDNFCVIHTWAHPGDYVRLTVSDSGEGMDAATQARIFEPFFTTKEIGRGTGLGLAVVYGIVKQHMGMIHVYSEVGKGTTFRIYLPFQDGTPADIAPRPSSELVGGTETILLAEDDDILRATAARLLERLGYRVISVATGRDALQTLLQEGDEIDLAVLDVVMPGLSGPEVLEHARAQHPDLRGLLTTGYSPATMHLKSSQGLGARVLTKPYGLHALAHCVRQALDGRTSVPTPTHNGHTGGTAPGQAIP
jgi:PAS domain S-box-containing protein